MKVGRARSFLAVEADMGALPSLERSFISVYLENDGRDGDAGFGMAGERCQERRDARASASAAALLSPYSPILRRF
jgi:hypothetical protein